MIETQNTKITYPGDDTRGPWTIDFPILEVKDVAAVRTDASGVQGQPLVYGTDYSVVKSSSGIGGTATTTDIVAKNTKITFYLDIEIEQSKDFKNTGPNDLEEHESALDKLTLICQQLNEEIDRAVKTGIGEGITPDELLERINDAVVEAEQSANEAEQDADRAEAAANNITGNVYEGTLVAAQTVITPTWTWRQGNLRVYLDGVLQQQSEYVEDTTAGTVTLNEAPGAGVAFSLLSTDTDSHGAFLQQALNLSEVNDKNAALNNLGGGSVGVDVFKANDSKSSRDVIGAAPNKNLIDNAGFKVNQREVSGTVTLTAGKYGHDRFKAGATGCTYTFSENEGVITITIIAGTLLQVVPGDKIFTGTHTLSWNGSSQGKINNNPYGDSGISDNLNGGVNVSIEWGVGTVSKPKLEKGTVVTEFIPIDPNKEMPTLMDRYFRLKNNMLAAMHLGSCRNNATDRGLVAFSLPISFNASPTLSYRSVSDFRILDSTGAKNCTSLTIYGHVGNIVILQYYASGLTNKELCMFDVLGSVGACLDFENEL